MQVFHTDCVLLIYILTVLCNAQNVRNNRQKWRFWQVVYFLWKIVKNWERNGFLFDLLVKQNVHYL